MGALPWNCTVSWPLRLPFFFILQDLLIWLHVYVLLAESGGVLVEVCNSEWRRRDYVLVTVLLFQTRRKFGRGLVSLVHIVLWLLQFWDMLHFTGHILNVEGSFIFFGLVNTLLGSFESLSEYQIYLLPLFLHPIYNQRLRKAVFGDLLVGRDLVSLRRG